VRINGGSGGRGKVSRLEFRFVKGVTVSGEL
jgi:hypothetical protein